MPALPEPKPRLLGHVSNQAKYWITLEASNDEFDAMMYALETFEAGELDQLPISPSYLIDGGYSILTTTGAFVTITLSADDETYDVLLAGVIQPPPDVVDP